MIDPFDTGALTSAMSVEEQIQDAGGRAAAAQRVALGLASEQVGSQVWASLPIPGAGTYELFVSIYEWVEGATVLFEPELQVSVDATSLQPGEVSRWRESPAKEDLPSLSWLSGDAARLDADVVGALELELKGLCERLAAPYAARAPLSTADTAALRRFDGLLRFLVAEPLLQSYERVSPDFFSWLAGVIGTGPLRHATDAPAPVGRFLQQARGPLGTNADVWLVEGAALLAAAAELGVDVGPHSPLQLAAGATALPADVAMADLVPEWPTEEWRVALETMSDPGWAIERVAVDGGMRTERCCYIGRSGTSVLWVEDLADGEWHLLSFPFGPEEVRDGLLAQVWGDEPVATQPTLFTLTATEVETALSLADLWNEIGEAVFDASAPSVRPDRPEVGPPTQPWASVASYLQMAPAGDDSWPPAYPPPSVKNLIRELGDLQRFARVRVRTLFEDGSSRSFGLIAARAGSRIWVLRPNGTWTDDELAPETEIDVLTVNEDELGQMVAILLGDMGGTDKEG